MLIRETMEHMPASVSLKTFFKPRYWYAWPVLALMLVMSRMPGRVLWWIGGLLGALFVRLPFPNRRFAERNIGLCFPEKTPDERQQLLKDHFRMSGLAAVCLGLAWFGSQQRLKKFVTVHGEQHLLAAAAAGKNVIALAPHFIGLDIGAARMYSEQGNRYVSMYRKSRDPLLEYLFQRRSRFGAVVLERSASLKTIIRLIREGRVFYYLPDQDMGERNSVFAPFFGIPAATITAVSRLAKMTDAAVIPCITRLAPGGRGCELHLYPPLEHFPTDDPEADAIRMNREIERWVREMPEQYMWTYRRFKTRPNNEPSLYA